MEGRGWVGGLSKKEKELIDKDNSVVFAGRREEGGGRRRYRGLSSDGKIN